MLKQILSKIPRKAFKYENSDPRSPNNVNSFSNGTPRAHKWKFRFREINSLKWTSSTMFPTSLVAGIEPLVSFKDVPNSEKMNLFLSKLNLCCVTFDFYDPSKNTSEKDIKRQMLIELVDFVASDLLRSSLISLLCVECVLLISLGFSLRVIGPVVVVVVEKMMMMNPCLTCLGHI